jgi:NAD(P)-dependent dehydrogenase (short-subunit alcohol dehydrogenase family)
VILARVGDLHQNKLKRVNAKTLDLSSLRSVREFASDVIKTEDRLDILIITSGTSVESDGATRDGLHPVMQANYFGPFLLTHLLAGTLYLEHLWNITLVTISGVPLALSQKLHLLFVVPLSSPHVRNVPNKVLQISDLLKKSAPSRIVFATSFLALFSNLSSENLNCIDLSKALTYSNAKCALSIASGLFSEKLKGSGVTSNCVTGFAFFEDLSSVYANTLFSFFNDVFYFLCAKVS